MCEREEYLLLFCGFWFVESAIFCGWLVVFQGVSGKWWEVGWP